MFDLEYYVLGQDSQNLADIDFTATPSTTKQTDMINLAGNLDHGGSVTALQATGTLSITTPGTYTFYVTSVGDADLLVDGVAATATVYGQNGQRLEVFTLELSAGEHELDVRGLQNTSAPQLQLEWSGPDSGGKRETLTSDALVDDAGTSQSGGNSTTDDGSGGSGGNSTTNDGSGGSGGDSTTDDGGSGSGGNSTTDDDGSGGSGGGSTTDNGGGGSGGDGTTDGGGGGTDSDSGSDQSGKPGPCPKTGDPICLCESEGEDHSEHDHGNHGSSDDALPQPTTPEEIEAYVAAVKAEPEEAGHHAHADDPGLAAEHSEVMDLVPRSEATHIAISDGDWSDPSTWYNGQIPDEGAKVLIPKGVAVRYDTESDESLFTVRVDGKLSFATDKDTKILVDTMVVSDSGHLEIGTEDNPIEAGVSADIVIANNGDIDVSWDPTLLSRGVISHGKVEIHGQEKTEFLKVADAPMAGDTTITLSEIPEGWEVGDTIVLTGTHKQGWRYSEEHGGRHHFESEDEEVTITSIDGNVVTIDKPLVHDHDTPRDDLSAYVANMSRSVTFSSEDGEASETHHRGHVMFMHNDDVDVRYAAFDDLGRTDKSVPAFDVENLDTVSADSNVKGRYSFHFHKTGTDIDEEPAWAIGNTVSGSPGWGFVHHSSHADFVSNVAFDVFGAAFAAEDGDETGIWSNNLAIRSEGIGAGDAVTKASADVARDDNGRTGDGFFFAGRMVEADNNIAANTTNGFVWMSRGPRTEVDTEHLSQSEIAYGKSTLNADKPVIQDFNNNEAFGTSSGIIVVKSGPHQNHDVRTVMDGFLNWETEQGVHLTYTGHYTLKDIDLIGTRSDIRFNEPETGLHLGQNSVDIVVNGVKVDGFETAVKFDGASREIPDSDFDHVIIDAELTNNEIDTLNFDPARHSFISSEDLVEGRLDFDWQGNPVVGGLQDVTLNGIKTDSIGSRERTTEFDPHVIRFWEFSALVKAEGYYTTTDGKNVFILEDFIADRATGELQKIGHIIELDGTPSKLANRYDRPSSGVIDLTSAAATAADDTASTSLNKAVIIDPLANDGNSGTVRLDGLTSPKNGDVTLRDDGTLLYTPHHDKSGTDSFSYWVTNGNGKFTKATVTVNVSSEEDASSGSGSGSGGARAAPVNNTTASAKADDLVIGTNDGIIYAQDGHDVVTGNSANNEVYGGAGEDTLMGAAGHDDLHGGSGEDVLEGQNGNDKLYGGFGNDALSGGGGNDTLSGDDGGDILTGKDGHDVLKGGTGKDELSGGTGEDVLLGGEGNDRLIGGIGNDNLRGGSENDYLNGGTGNDNLRGESENDYLNGGKGNDVLFGDKGNDTLTGESGRDVLQGNSGRDLLKGGAGNDRLDGGSGNDSLHGGAGNDELFGDFGNDALAGGGGNDTLSGDAGGDTLNGKDGDDVLNGGSGRDQLYGGGGRDLLNGDKGNDNLRGGSGRDVLDGGKGNDVLRGGSDADRFYIQKGDGKDRIIDFQAEDTLELDGFLRAGQSVRNSASENADGDLTISNGSDSITFTGLTLEDLDWMSIV